MASTPCTIESCKRVSNNLCEHCQQLVCTKHYIEHIKIANDKLPTLADELNCFINSIQERDFTQHVFEQIEQWRDQTHQHINDLCEAKKNSLKIEINEKIHK